MNNPEGVFAGARAIVTGGYGLIGASIVRKLVDLGASVTVVDAMFPEMGGHRQNLADLEGRFDFLQQDYTRIDDWSAIIGNADVLFHLAGQTDHAGSMREPERDLTLNQAGLLRLLEACRMTNPELRFLFSSTRQIYGRPERLPVDENHRLNPPDINAVHKIAAENYLSVFASVYGLRPTVLRLTNTYGPGMRVKDARQTFVGIWLRRVLEGDPFEIWGKETIRDLTFVDDCADAFLRAAAADRAVGEIYNIGGPGPITLGEFGEALVAANGGGTFELREMPDERSKIDIGNFYADDNRIAEHLGWHASTDIEAGLRKTLDWYRPRLDEYIRE